VLRIAAVAADVSWLMNPAGEKFEPTHVGCYGISSGGFNRRCESAHNSNRKDWSELTFAATGFRVGVLTADFADDADGGRLIIQIGRIGAN
jgi:hypothetical protein